MTEMGLRTVENAGFPTSVIEKTMTEMTDLFLNR